MQKLTINKLPLLLLFLPVISINASQFTQKIPPVLTIDVFNLKEKLKKDPNYVGKLLASNIQMSPSKKELVIGAEGEIHRLDLAPTQQKLELLYTHSHAKSTPPLIALAQQPDNPLIIASALNYSSSENGQWNSNFILCYSKDSMRPPQTFDYPIQALSFDKQGEILLIGGPTSVALFNLKEKSIVKTILYIPGFTTGLLIDLAIEPNGNSATCINQAGMMQHITISEKKEINKFHEVYCEGKFNSIHRSNIRTLLAHGHQNIVSIIDIYHLIGDNTVRPIPSNPLTTTKENYEQVTLNTGSMIAA